MSRGGLSAQKAPKPPADSMSDLFIAPALLPVCCVCALIRDTTGSRPGLEHWVSQRTFQRLHGMNPDDFLLTHTYCPTCFAKVQEMVREYFRKIGTQP